MTEREIILEEDDGIALRTRGHRADDEEAPETERLKEKTLVALVPSQLPDGSWGRTICRTLSNLHLLIHVYKIDSTAFRRGFDWILSLTSLLGFHEYWEEGTTIHGRDVNCPYARRLGTRELSGQVLHLFDRIGSDAPIVDETRRNTFQLPRTDGGFHGPRFCEEDGKRCPGATLWLARGLPSLGRGQNTVKEAMSFIEQEDVVDTAYRYSTSALGLETHYLHSPEDTPRLTQHVDYRLSL